MSEAHAPWYAAFPSPSSSPDRISAEDLHQHLANGNSDIIVVDVRRNDFEDAFIKGAINLPAHSFFQTLPGVVSILSKFKTVVFHCQSCSAGGRGARTAAWYQDALNERGIQGSTAFILEGGIKGWIEKYEGDELTVKL